MDRKMRPLPVSELFMAGPALSGRFRSLGIRTIGELADADPEFIRTHLKRPGEVLQGYARGRELEPYIFTHEENKGYGNSMTAPADILTEEYACHLLLSLCETVGARLRHDGVRAAVVGVHITTCEFQRFSRQRKLADATDITEELYQAACRSFLELWDGRTPVRQIGVHASKTEKSRESLMCGRFYVDEEVWREIYRIAEASGRGQSLPRS